VRRQRGRVGVLGDLRLLGELNRDALRYFALNGTDHRSHTEQNAAIAAYVRWRITRAQPKVTLAVGSSIRPWSNSPVKAA
jgi:hypothetical protein